MVNWTAFENQLDELDGDLDGFDRVQLATAIVDMAKMRARSDAVWLHMARLADEQSLGRDYGARTTHDWLAHVAGEKPGVMARDLELAAALAESPVVAEAMGRGLSKAKAAELVESGLPLAVQRELVGRAMSGPVAQVTAEVRRAKFEHGVREAVVEPAMTLVRAGDRVKLEATLDLVDGEFVEVALDTAAADLPRELPYKQRRAKALVALARFYLDNAKTLPSTRVGRPHAFVFVDLSTIEREHGGSATLGSGAVISGEEARRLLCDANINRVITNGRSAILDVGMTTRNPPIGLAKAVIARDRHCRYVDCHAPPWMCEIHHRRPWNKHGPTSLDNLGLLCWYHHQQLHRQGAHLLTVTKDDRWTLRVRKKAA